MVGAEAMFLKVQGLGESGKGIKGKMDRLNRRKISECQEIR